MLSNVNKITLHVTVFSLSVSDATGVTQDTTGVVLIIFRLLSDFLYYLSESNVAMRFQVFSPINLGFWKKEYHFTKIAYWNETPDIRIGALKNATGISPKFDSHQVRLLIRYNFFKLAMKYHIHTFAENSPWWLPIQPVYTHLLYLLSPSNFL